MLSCTIFLLLIFDEFLYVSKVVATDEKFFETPGLPNIQNEPLPLNFTVEDYLNTTNPYTLGVSFYEYDDVEGDRPLYVLVFVDEERGR